MLKFIIPLMSVFLLALSPNAFAQDAEEVASADEARAMLARAVAAIKSDKSAAIDMFNNGEGGFLDRDLYPFCIQASDGVIVAQGGPLTDRYVGQNMRSLEDAVGKAYGEEIFAAAQRPEGEMTEVSYMFSKPIVNAPPVPKVSFITRVSDLGCGVGYYK